MCFLRPKPCSNWPCTLTPRHFILLLSFLGTLCNRVGVTGSQDHAYIPTEDNLFYLVEGMVVPIKREDTLSKESADNWKDDSGSVAVLGSPIGFEPGELDFGGQPIGVPVLQKVRVHNLNAENSIQMLSVSGNTVHFHCSFFASKVIPPLGNTTFDVVFLGREKDAVENTLYVHTSAGSFRFNVKARGSGDPYGLSPMTGITLPLNTTYNRTISLTNPGPEPLQVLEMSTSGSSDLSLVSPNGEIERPENSWTIPPFTTKVLMLAKFFARKEKNYTAYIRIRTNATSLPGKFLYVPFEALVVERVGVFASDPLLDFGTFVLGVDNKPVTKDCLVYSTGFKKLVPFVANRFGEDIILILLSSHFPLSSPYLTSIASATFFPLLEGLFEGVLEIASMDKQHTVMWKYRALVLNGTLSYNKSTTAFFIGNDSREIIQKKLTIKNEFKVPVKILGIQRDSPSSLHFSFLGFQPVILSPNEEKDILVISYNRSSSQESETMEEDMIQESASICVFTDAYNLNITFRTYDGKIKKVLPDSPSQDYLDFGSLGMAVTRDSEFILRNPNPVNVSILSMSSNCSGCSLDCSKERLKVIPPGKSIPYCLRVLTSEKEESILSQIFISTTYESIKIPVKYRVVRGSLITVPENLEFAPVFPGEKTELKLTVYSSFAQEMITNDVVTVPRDDSFSFQHGVIRGRNVIMSVEKSYIGKVIFDPALGCRKTQSCYVGFEMESKLGQLWLSTLNATSMIEIWKTMDSILEVLGERYLYLYSLTSPKISRDQLPGRPEDLPHIESNVALSLNTNQIRGFLFRAKTKMFWPSVIEDQKVNFPCTQIGNSSIGTFKLRNPSSIYPLYVYLVLNSLQKSPFQILAIESEEPVQGLHYEDLALLNSKSFVLPPSNSVVVKLKFIPSKVAFHENGIMICNNLTVYEYIPLKGKGSSPSFRLGIWKTDADNLQPLSGNLVFEIREKDLGACSSSSSSSPKKQAVSQVLTVRDSVKAQNMGEVPIWILGFYIGEYPCEGYGFKVIDCKPFRLEPKAVRDIEIGFTPDFTMSYVGQVLHIHSTVDIRPLNYTLRASLPPKMLSLCAAILPRPMWESWIYYIMNLGLFLVFLGVLLAAKLETNCIWSFYENESQSPSSSNSIMQIQKVENHPDGGDKVEASIVEDIPNKSEGGILRQRRPRRSAADGHEEADSQQISGLKGHLNSFLDMVVPRSKEERKTSSSSSSSSPLPPNKGGCSSNGGLVGGKGKKQKQNKSGSHKSSNASASSKKALEEAESSSTTTESSNVEDLSTELSSAPPLPLAPKVALPEAPHLAGTLKNDLKKAKNSKKVNSTNAASNGGSSSSSKKTVAPALDELPGGDVNESIQPLDFSQPVMKKTRPHKSHQKQITQVALEDSSENGNSSKKPLASTSKSPVPSTTTGKEGSSGSIIVTSGSPQQTPPTTQRKKQQAKVKPNEQLSPNLVPNPFPPSATKNNSVASSTSRNSSPITSSFDKPPRMLLPKSCLSLLNHPPDKALCNSHSNPEQKGKKVPPVGKIIPEGSHQYGPIGAPRRQTEAAKLGRGDLARTLQLNNSLTAAIQEGTFGVGANGGGGGSIAGTNSNATAASSSASSSLMQSLQAERRQRTEEFLLKNRRPVDWPGFDNNNQSSGNLLESLWDRPEEMNNAEGFWGGAPRGFATAASGGIWSNHDFWGGQSTSSSRPPPQQEQQITMATRSFYPQDQLDAVRSNSKEQQQAANFYHLSSIWAGEEDRRIPPQQPSEQNDNNSSSSTWSSTLFHANQI